jgi:hypothetical protein
MALRLPGLSRACLTTPASTPRRGSCPAAGWLGPAAGVGERVVARIQAADEGEEVVVDDLADVGEGLVRRPRAGSHADAELVLLVAVAVPVGAGVGEHAQQRLAAELEAALLHLDGRAVGVLVHLVGQGAVRARAGALLAAVAADRPEERTALQVSDVVFLASPPEN